MEGKRDEKLRKRKEFRKKGDVVGEEGISRQKDLGRQRSSKSKRETYKIVCIPPADAVHSIERANKLSCFKGAKSSVRWSSIPVRLLVCRRSWRLLIFNTRFFAAYSSYWREIHGGAVNRVPGKLTRCTRQ